MLPAREFPLDEAGRARFRSRWREIFEGDPSKKRLYRDVSNGVPAAGVEYYLPLFFESVATLFDYLPAGTHARAASRRERRDPGVLARRAARATRCWAATRTGRCCRRRSSSSRPRSSSCARKDFARIDVCRSGRSEAGRSRIVCARRCRRSRSTGARTIRSPRSSASSTARSCASWSRPSRRAGARRWRPTSPNTACKPVAVRELRGISVEPASSFCSCVSPARARLHRARRRLGDRHRGRALRRRGARARGRARREAQLRRGDAARPVGAEGRRPGGARAARHRPLPGAGQARPRTKAQSEFLLLEYEGGDKLYVPVAQLGVIGRYSGAQPEEAPLHKLGSGAVGQGEGARGEAGARHGRRAARAVREARRAPRAFLRGQAARPGSLRRRLRLRGDARPGRGDRGRR